MMKQQICNKGYTTTYKTETQSGSFEKKSKVEYTTFYFEKIIHLPDTQQVKGILTIEDPKLFLAGFRKNIMPGRDYIAATEYKGLICVKEHLLNIPDHLIKNFLEFLQITKVQAD